MKIAIAQCGTASVGKSTTVRLIFDTLRTTYIEAKVAHLRVSRKEVRAILTVGSARIGIESHGDPGSEAQKASLKLFVREECDAIICACRTRGETHDLVAKLAEHGYTLDWRARIGAPTNAKNKAEADYAIKQLRKLIG